MISLAFRLWPDGLPIWKYHTLADAHTALGGVASRTIIISRISRMTAPGKNLPKTCVGRDVLNRRLICDAYPVKRQPSE